MTVFESIMIMLTFGGLLVARKMKITTLESTDKQTGGYFIPSESPLEGLLHA